MARFRPADRRFCHHWCFVIRQSELDADAFAGKERNLRAQSHTPSADIYAVAPNFLYALAPDDDWNGDRVTEVASPFSQDEPVCRLESFVDRLRRERSLEDKLRFLAESRRNFRIIIADAERDRRPVRWGETCLVQNVSGLISELKINDNGIEFSTLQEKTRACRVLTCIGRNRQFSQGEAELLNCNWISGHQKCKSYGHK